jgi:hypothetical protein
LSSSLTTALVIFDRIGDRAELAEVAALLGDLANPVEG